MLALFTTSAAPKTYSEPWTKTIMCLHRLVCLSQPHKAVVKSTSISTATSSLSTESYTPHSSVSTCYQQNACAERISLDIIAFRKLSTTAKITVPLLLQIHRQASPSSIPIHQVPSIFLKARAPSIMRSQHVRYLSTLLIENSVI